MSVKQFAGFGVVVIFLLGLETCGLPIAQKLMAAAVWLLDKL